jgi:hypothetical protein
MPPKIAPAVARAVAEPYLATAAAFSAVAGYSPERARLAEVQRRRARLVCYVLGVPIPEWCQKRGRPRGEGSQAPTRTIPP